MNPDTRHNSPHTHQARPNAMLAHGDERWAHREPVWRERDLALSWPQDLLEAFSLRMAAHGMSLSRPLMLCDRPYALQQLVHAQNMADASLRDLAKQLLTHFDFRRTDADLSQ